MKKLMVLMGISSIIYGTSFNAFNNVKAIDIADPSLAWAEWYIKYDYDTASGRMELTSSTLGTNGNRPLFSRIGTSSPYSYENTDLTTMDYLGSTYVDVSIGMYFEKSTTSWALVGGGLYAPNSGATYVGSNNVSSVVAKVSFSVSNETGNYKYIAYNLSDSTSGVSYYVDFNDNNFAAATYNVPSTSISTTAFQYLPLPPYTTISVVSNATSNAVYLRSLYILDVIGSPTDTLYQDAYDEGYDDGYDVSAGISISNASFLQIFSATFDAVKDIFNIHIMGGITLGTIALFPLMGIFLLFFKKVIQ